MTYVFTAMYSDPCPYSEKVSSERTFLLNLPYIYREQAKYDGARNMGHETESNIDTIISKASVE